MNSPSLANPFRVDRLNRSDDYRPEWDVPSIHEQVSRRLLELVEIVARSKAPDPNAKIPVLLGTSGYGKTHLFGRLAHQCKDRCFFVFVPQLEERATPSAHVHWNFVQALFGERPGPASPLAHFLARLCQPSFAAYFAGLPPTWAQENQGLGERLARSPEAVLELVSQVKSLEPHFGLGESFATHFPNERSEVLRALALVWSPAASDACRWLRGESLSDARCEELGLPESPPSTTSVLRAIAALLRRLGMVLVVCCDQSEVYMTARKDFDELTNSFIGWLHDIPSLLVVLSCLKDPWVQFLRDSANSAFPARTEAFDLQAMAPMGEAQAIELIRRRLHPDGAVSEIHPFVPANVAQFVQEMPMAPRVLLQRCAQKYDEWRAGQCKGTIDVGDVVKVVRTDELFRQEWGRTLVEVRTQNISPDNLQEQRLFRALREALLAARQSRTNIGGTTLLQLQDGALTSPKSTRELSLEARVGVGDKAHAVVVATTKMTGGVSLTNLFNRVQDAIKPPVLGAVLVRPTGEMKLGARGPAKGREVFDALVKVGKLRTYDWADHLPAFQVLECYLRLLDKAKAQELRLGDEEITEDRCRQLTAQIKALDGLDLLEAVCCGWPGAPVPAVAAPPVAPAPAKPPPAIVAAPVVAPVKPAAVAVAAPPTHRQVPRVPSPPPGDGWANELLRAVARKLTGWGQAVEAMGVDIGPTFARLKVRPLNRTTLGKVRNTAADLRIHLQMETMPLIADQAGHISIDVRRPDRQTVPLTPLLDAAPAELDGAAAFPVGVDVSGQAHWLDLSEPSTCHLLVAGTTGSGKSEFLKALLAGLAARLDPMAIQFILIDPKRVTFNFSGLSPYLQCPVAHTLDEGLPLVRYCFDETERRYALLEEHRLEHVGQLRGKEALPRIVLVMDEFADLMTDKDARRDLETTLRRLGALARAAGIHLVLATQRPEAGVVTPLLRANLPTRICLHVDSDKNSSLILDEGGGQHLLGRGDLLWKRGGGLLRLQSPYVDREELEKLLRVT